MNQKMTRQNKPIRVFISYSHDSPKHKDWVRELAEFLKSKGIDARLDQWEFDRPRDGWPGWCSRQVVAADYILMICNQTYCDKFHGLAGPDFGRGVRWEGRAIQNLTYFDYCKAVFLAVVTCDDDRKYIPVPLNDCTTSCLLCSPNQHWEETELLRRLQHAKTGGPLPIPKPPAEFNAEDVSATVPDDASILTSDVFKAIEGLDDRLRLFNEEYRRLFVPVEFLEDLESHSRAESSQSPNFHDLHYNRQWLDYIPPVEAEKAVNEFVNDSAPFLWWGITASGGVGKSRLAHELFLRLRKDQGWDAGFLSGESGTTWLTEKSSGWRPRRPSLLVVDYAATRGTALVTAIRQLAANLVPNEVDVSEGKKMFPKVRLLFLDRPAQSVPIFQEFLNDPREYDRQRAVVRKHLWTPPDVAKFDKAEDSQHEPSLMRPITSSSGLQPIVTAAELLRLENPSRTEWPNILEGVIARVSEKPDPLPALENTEFWNRVSRLTSDGRLLFLQLLGICLATDPSLKHQLTGTDGSERLLDLMLDRERKFRWNDLLGEHAENIATIRQIERALGFITLTRGVEIPKDRENVRKASGASDADEELLLYVLPRFVTVQQMQPSSIGDNSGSQQFSPVEPDLLGERLLIRLASATGTGFTAGVSPDNWLPLALQCNSPGTAATIGLLASDFPHHPATSRWVNALLDRFEFEDGNHASLDTVSEIASLFSTLAFGEAPVAKSIADKLLKKAQQNFLLLPYLILSLAGKLNDETAGSNAVVWHQLLIDLCQMPNDQSEFLVLKSFLATEAIGVYGTAGQFDKLEPWGKLLDDVAESNPESSEIQLALAHGAMIAIGVYGTAGQFGNLERWGERLNDVAESSPENGEIQLELAKGATNAIGGYGKASQFGDLERWGELLNDLAKSNPESGEIQLELATGTINAIGVYGKAGQFGDLERWGELLKDVAKSNPENGEIQLALAKGVYNAIGSYDTAGQFDKLEPWGELLNDSANSNPESGEIQLLLAQVAFKLITAYIMAEQFGNLERWGERLNEVAESNPESGEIQLKLAQGAMLAIGGYGTAGQIDKLEPWGERLNEVAESNPESSEIQQALAHGAMFAIDGYGKAGQFDDLERWGKLLQDVAESNSENGELQLELAQGAFNAITYYIMAGQLDRLERWGELLNEVAESNPESSEIQLALAHGAMLAIGGYRKAGHLDDLERWGELLQYVAESNPENGELQLELAKGAFNAIAVYGMAGQFGDLERWGKLLQHVAESRPESGEIQLELARGAINAIAFYGTAGQFDDLKRWARLLAEVLPLSAMDATTMQAVADFSIMHLSQYSPVAIRLLQILNSYWPGFQLTLPDQQTVPLCLAVGDLFSEKRQKTDKKNLKRCNGLMNSIQSAQFKSEPALTKAVAKLWPLRMYLPDRGDSLLPLLQQLQMTKKLEEAYSDPWRQGEKP